MVGLYHVCLHLAIKRRTEMNINQGRRCPGTLHVATNTNKIPTFIVYHGGIGDALKELDTFLDGGKEFVRSAEPHIFHTRTLHMQVEPVNLFPHLRVNLFTYLLCIITSSSNTRDNRGGIVYIKG